MLKTAESVPHLSHFRQVRGLQTLADVLDVRAEVLEQNLIVGQVGPHSHVALAFADRYRVIVPDLRGHGRGTGTPETIRYAQFGADLSRAACASCSPSENDAAAIIRPRNGGTPQLRGATSFL